MGIQNLFRYYREKTKKYPVLVEKKVKELVGDSRIHAFVGDEDLEEAALDIFSQLSRIQMYREENRPVTDTGIIEDSDDCTVTKLKIQVDILECIEKRGDKLSGEEGVIRLKK